MNDPQTQLAQREKRSSGSLERDCSVNFDPDIWRERVYVHDVKQEGGEIWLRISAANAPRGTPPAACFCAGQILVIHIKHDPQGVHSLSPNDPDGSAILACDCAASTCHVCGKMLGHGSCLARRGFPVNATDYCGCAHNLPNDRHQPQPPTSGVAGKETQENL